MGGAKMKILHRRLLLGRAKHRRIFLPRRRLACQHGGEAGTGSRSSASRPTENPPLAGDSSMGPYWTEP